MPFLERNGKKQVNYEIAEQANQDRKIYATLKEIYINDFIDSIVEEEKRTQDKSLSHIVLSSLILGSSGNTKIKG